MHWSDLLIIYLSCGAPFGVYFFLKGPVKSHKAKSVKHLLKSAAAGLLWIGYAYLLWRKNIAKRLTKQESFSPNPEISLLEQQTSMLQEQILQSFVDFNAETGSKLNFFAFRDIMERYIGLTLALKADETIAGESDFEVFRIAGRKKKELPVAGKCLARKISMRLKSHQCNAREDFLKYIAKLTRQSVQTNGNGQTQNNSLLKDLILELFELTDVKTLQQVEHIFSARENAPEYSENGFETSEVIKCQPPPPVSAAKVSSNRQPHIGQQPTRNLLMRRSAD